MALAKNFFFILLNLLLLFKAESKCPKSFECGNLGPLGFPLSKDPMCGQFVIEGCDSPSPTLHTRAAGVYWYNFVKNVSANQFLLSDPQLQQNLIDRSCFSFRNLTLPQSPTISFTLVSPNITFFTCSNQTPNQHIQSYFRNYSRVDCRAPPRTLYYANLTTNSRPSVPSACSLIQLPAKTPHLDKGDIFNLLSGEFTLEWKVSEACYRCYNEGGLCLAVENTVYCKKGKTRLKKIFLIGGVTALISTAIVLCLFILRKYTMPELLWYQKESADEEDIEVFLKTNGNLSPTRYKYAEVKKMTKSFCEKLGKGGYGSVYKGKLPDGRLVAVKVLNESKENGEEFMNEVASISRTSHVNIVSLLGFCFQGSKRALIYEFMPNGSLEKFIQNTSSSSVERWLGWQKLLEIALGIARGLEYLHQGCKTRILHFDIKPHNILLDKDFNPRISDFGLAKLCPNRSSIVSMLVARGTIGYIAPEVFCRNFGEVSHKSDVYSYGMMVLEIAGGRKNNDPIDMDCTSEIYFPDHIYKQLEMDSERDGIMNEDESQSEKRKLIIVGLWCIQTDPRDRPSMMKVVEMLEGKLETLQVPPKPYLSSPPRSPLSFSSSGSM